MHKCGGEKAENNAIVNIVLWLKQQSTMKTRRERKKLKFMFIINSHLTSLCSEYNRKLFNFASHQQSRLQMKRTEKMNNLNALQFFFPLLLLFIWHVHEKWKFARRNLKNLFKLLNTKLRTNFIQIQICIKDKIYNREKRKFDLTS